MTSSRAVNRWLWKWHIISGLICLPFLVFLAVTGILYMFKEPFEKAQHRHITHVETQSQIMNLDAQLKVAQEQFKQPITKIVLKDDPNQATTFVIGKRSQKQTIYVDPYKGEVTGKVVTNQTAMYKVRKLHGALLLGKYGGYLIELVACWMFVLMFTGIYIWWPGRNGSWKAFFRIRMAYGKRLFYRDLHAVLSFWLSLAMLVILAGGLPWTEVFGAQYKKVQSVLKAGYPSFYHSGKNLKSTFQGDPLSLEQMVEIARGLQLKGELSLKLPNKSNGIFTVSNRAVFLKDQWVHHFDAHSGRLLKSYPWSSVGSMMNLRQILMRLHQGEYGKLNWWALLWVNLFFIVSIVAGFISYLIRKPKGRWGIPKVPPSFKLSWPGMVLVGLMAITLPLFGLSVILIWSGEKIVRSKFHRAQ